MYIYSLRPYVPPPDYLKAYSTQIDSAPSLKIDSLNLGSLITDNVEISDAAKLAAAAFEDFSKVDNILRRADNSLTAFAKEYARRRDLIIKAGETDETYKANQAKLIDALDTAMRDRVSAFADDCVTLIGKVASLVSAGDADLVQSGWVRGYQGSEKLWLSSSEERGIKADIKEMFSLAMKSGSESVPSGKNANSVPNGQFIASSDFAGRSFYRKLEDFSSQIVNKGYTRWAMKGTEEGERSVRAICERDSLGLKAFQYDWETFIVDMEDTSAIEKFSGGLKAILSRFDEAASVHKRHSDLEYDQSPAVDESMKKVADKLDPKVLAAGTKTFEKYAPRIERFADKLSDSQKSLLGVMYHDAETLGTKNAFKKVDAFAKALATKNFYGFRFEPLSNPKNLTVLNLLQWFNDDEASTGIPKDRATQKLTADERKALITQKYLPHLVVGDETTQDDLAQALFKLGKADEVKRLNLKYSK
ncbi:hypothetical protein [uncultured Mobiluncus sp.]|uniref:hypothetical protein n=1 Tax=uncultured Mobiluncus sp. TaxID=293425 RepID=UPI00262E6A46|nr:hypothetical protein [uncultured Mobiluncus sp.]